MQRWTDAKARLGSDENHQKMESLCRELEDQKRRYDDLKRQASEYDHIVSEFKKLVQDLFVQGILDPEGVALPLPENTDYTEKITAIQKEMGNHSETLSDQLGTLSVSIRRLEQECRYLSDEIRQLQNGRMVYPEECGIVLGAINDMFAERGIRDKAALLCELLYMNRPEWQDAVESYLNTQRFHVIVPPEQYWLAKQVFMSLGDKVKGIGLIDTVSLMRRQEKRQDGGLADILKLSGTVGTENPYARAYVDFRLGDVVCCSSADDLEKLDIGLSTRYDWGIVACISSDCYARYRKGNFSMQYGQFLQHAPRSAGMRYCVAEQSDDDTTLAAQICQSETGKKTADEQGTIDSIGGFFLYYY